MKKLIAFLTLGVFLTSCSLITGIQQGTIKPTDAQNVAFYSFGIAQDGIVLADLTKLAIKAGKAGKVDSVLFYSAQIDSVAVNVKEYEDSLISYVNKLSGKK